MSDSKKLSLPERKAVLASKIAELQREVDELITDRNKKRLGGVSVMLSQAKSLIETESRKSKKDKENGTEKHQRKNEAI